MRVLLVEDHAAIREALASTFEERGLRGRGPGWVHRRGQRDARGLEHPIDVALIDLGLPDGYRLS